MNMLTVGQSAPDFTLTDQNNTEITLSDSNGRWRIVYFYPEDDTPGCTTEACRFRDAESLFQERGTIVYGISPDSSGSHQRFAKKYRLNFTLLSDPSAETIRAYGALADTALQTIQPPGVRRITYIIDPQGQISAAFAQVTPATHVQEILSSLDELRVREK